MGIDLISVRSMQHHTVTKRLHISLPDGIADELERWAKSEGNKPTSLAAFLVERAVRERLERIEIEAQQSKGSSNG
jgi:hypothetical protein